jgi:hypothetical protein
VATWPYVPTEGTASPAEDDGTVEWCGDSVAAQLLRVQDGKPRDARGDLLKQGDETGEARNARNRARCAVGAA